MAHECLQHHQYSVGVFKTAPCVLYTNGQSPFYVEAFLDPSKYAGKTVRVLAYCRVDTTNGGNVQGVGRISYLTNTAGGADPNFPLSIGGQSHGSIGVFKHKHRRFSRSHFNQPIFNFHQQRRHNPYQRHNDHCLVWI
jgi:hypothetical protein